MSDNLIQAITSFFLALLVIMYLHNILPFISSLPLVFSIISTSVSTLISPFLSPFGL
uniref:Uncharacterized protein n=1 Tax=Mimiviridae sp. ChoanoV1 TaxID=2596887 RepID=A0A5B8IDU7_9VIRU|nr:hypothetical protein 2_78 [Mimiviridae sp. ChoanoV1]